MISTLVSLPYELARLPLALVDSRVAEKLPESSPPRVLWDRALGSADRIAGAVLVNRDIATRGENRIERSQKLATADRLEREAAARREQAEETATAGRQEAARQRKAAQDRAAAGLEEADAVETQGKQDAKAKASRTASARKSAADQRAARRTATVEQRKERADSTAEAKRGSVEREATTQLGKARQSKRSAAEARADADRLEDLTEAKKQERRQS